MDSYSVFILLERYMECDTIICFLLYLLFICRFYICEFTDSNFFL